MLEWCAWRFPHGRIRMGLKYGLLVGKCLINTYLLPQIVLGSSQESQSYWRNNIHIYKNQMVVQMTYYQVLHCVVQPGGPVGFMQGMDLKQVLKEDRI